MNIIKGIILLCLRLEVKLMYKQIIIARKDLNMSPGKLSAQVAHGSMAFLKELVIKNTIKIAKFRYLCRRKDDSMQPFG